MSILFSQKYGKNNEILPQEANFTEVLSSIALVPKTLYFYGKMPENRVKNRIPAIAVVGTRKPTEYGRKIAYDIAFEAARRGAIVISGLALGIDAVAHRAALDAGGITVAVLGTPIDEIYPRQNYALAAEILEKDGMILSEIPSGAAYGKDYLAKTSFLRRNRLISGLADVVVVAEAAARSGSLNTASHALEQGKDIFAVPGDVDRVMSQGCNQLIARSGAQIYTDIQQILGLLFPGEAHKADEISEKTLVGGTDLETAILRMICAGNRDGEAILAKIGTSAAEFNQAVTMLEINGQVESLGCNKWRIRKC